MTTGWGESGLPPAARARLERAAASGVRTSLLPGAAGPVLAAVGLEPVGEVMGTAVMHLGWQGFGGCGQNGGYPFGPSRVQGSRSATRFSGYRPYVQALQGGYDTALRRMLREATALHADGVVAVRLTADHVGSGTREFLALGTAVRARSRTRPPRPFATDRPATEVVRLLQAGWVPVAVAVGIEVAIRHDDARTSYQVSRFNRANVEVTGFTDLVQYARAAARARLAERIAQAGADGAVVSSMQLHVHEIEPGEGHTDHVAEATIVGTVIARFHREAAAPTRTLTVMPLRARARTAPARTGWDPTP